MDFIIKLSEQQINLWGQVLLEARLTHAESITRGDLLQSINAQVAEQRKEPPAKTNGVRLAGAN